jgi:transposase
MKSIFRFDLNKLIPNLKKQNPWLGEVNSQSFQGRIKHVESAFTRFFRERMVFLNSDKRRTQFSHSRDYNTTMWILKIILLSFLRLEKSKQLFTKHLNGN